MVCPFCLHKKTEVYNSRPTKKLNALWRRRRCQQCKRQFTTREKIDVESILKVRPTEHSKKTMQYSNPTLLLSLLQVCDHLPNKASIYWLSDTIEQTLLTLGANQDGIITKSQIVETCLTILKRFDTPAFVKYLSYHSPDLDARTLKKQLRG